MTAKKRIEELENRLEEMHEIIDRKNAIIRLLSMGDLSQIELSGIERTCPLPVKPCE